MTVKARINPSITNLLVMLLVILTGLSTLFPLRVTPASAAPDNFSAERALGHLSIVAHEPHPSGSPAQDQVVDYLVQQLTDLGLEVEVQQAMGVKNVIARLHGTNSSGAVLIQAHSDSYKGPGAADNGSGVAAVLEVMRALAASPAPRNDIIALFDDGEEPPDAFTGTKAFIRKHPWMADVRVAIGLDTAVQGPTSVVDTGYHNGWMVGVLSRVYTNASWTSLSGGGGYDTGPFKNAGIQILELEDNYPFYEQHTPLDVPEIVNPASLQQLGDQALAVSREISMLDLAQTTGEQQTFLFIPYLALLHYPQAWAPPLAGLAVILLLIAFGLAFWRYRITWRGLGVALLSMLLSAALAAAFVYYVWKAAPGLLGWQTAQWPEWPEVIPPYGWLILLGTSSIILVFTVLVYRFARRWSSAASFSLSGLLFFALLSLAVAVSEPRGAGFFTWPVIIGSVVWVAALGLERTGRTFPVERIALLAAVPTMIYTLPLLPSVFMSDGTKSVAITAGVWVIVLAILLPAVDGLIHPSAATVHKFHLSQKPQNL